jgi:hypothetical protein
MLQSFCLCFETKFCVRFAVALKCLTNVLLATYLRSGCAIVAFYAFMLSMLCMFYVLLANLLTLWLCHRRFLCFVWYTVLLTAIIIPHYPRWVPVLSARVVQFG